MRKLFFALSLMAGFSSPAMAGAPGAALIEQGRYLAVAGDCFACHTQSGKGGHAISSPLGAIYATNITPSRTAGIGSYTLAQFSNAVRHGVRADGSQLYPAMPYTAYAKLTDADLGALYAYFMHSVQPVDTPAPQTRLPFPFNLRFSMKAWNGLFLDDKPYAPVPGQSVEWNRGAYLVQGLAHCSTCHTPRNALMAEKGDQFLRGSSLGTWYAPDLVAGNWSGQDMVAYLTTGHAANGATAGGPMLEAIDLSFSRMRPADVQAMATYLHTLSSGAHGAANAAVPAMSASDLTEMTGKLRPGEQLYRDNCASCHQNNGDGMRGLPALRNHPVLRQPNADNVAMAILQGVWPEHRQGMPGFAAELTDSQIAAISNYVIADFGHGKAVIDDKRVQSLRNGGDTPLLLTLARGGMLLGALLAVLLLLFLLMRRRKRKA